MHSASCDGSPLPTGASTSRRPLIVSPARAGGAAGRARSASSWRDDCSGARRAIQFTTVIGDELVVAWTESYRSDDYDDPEGGYALVRLARVSGDGELLGPPERLQAAEAGIVSALSSLLLMDGAIAIAWSRETFIPACGGCISDATIRVILLDPVDLVPVSDAVELVGPSGLKSAPMVGADDGDVAFFLTVDYHALRRPGSRGDSRTRAP